MIYFSFFFFYSSKLDVAK